MEYYFDIFLLDSDGFFIEKEKCCVEAESIDQAYSLADVCAEEFLGYEYESGVPDSYETKLVFGYYQMSK